MGQAIYWEMASTRATKIVTSIIVDSRFQSHVKIAKPMKSFQKMQHEHIEFAFQEFDNHFNPAMLQKMLLT